jgi:hypothetical protein
MVPILAQMKWSLSSARWNGPYPQPDEMVPILIQMKWSLSWPRWNGPYPEPDEMAPILSQMKPVHNLHRKHWRSISYCTPINIYVSRAVPLGLPTKTPHGLLSRTCDMQSHRMKLHTEPYIHLPPTVASSVTCIFLGALFSNTLSLRYSLNVTDQTSHPHKTTNRRLATV